MLPDRREHTQFLSAWCCFAAVFPGLTVLSGKLRWNAFTSIGLLTSVVRIQ